MDKELIIKRFSKAMQSYDKAAEIQHQIACTMMELLESYTSTSFPNILEVGCGTGYYSKLLAARHSTSTICFNDICEEMCHALQPLLTERTSFLPGDAEAVSFPEQLHLITSCSTFQWFENIASFFDKCSRQLLPNGYFAFSSFGTENMKEIATLTGVSLPYRTKEELITLLTPYYEIIYAHEDKLSLTFPNALQVLYHLKHTGVSAIESKPWTKGALRAFCHAYDTQFKKNEGVVLTYHPLYIIARKK
ncbi:MAG: malonyl-ACP O-methyltransferase BioC [Bacteroidaceae bacterium]|nr:malonyl-ACP O-methyltransferase BioC [Bacteroidaceae bacterium]